MFDPSLHYPTIENQGDSQAGPVEGRWLDGSAVIPENTGGISGDQAPHVHYPVISSSYTPGSLVQEPANPPYSQVALVPASLHDMEDLLQQQSFPREFSTPVTGDGTLDLICPQNDHTAEDSYREAQHLLTELCPGYSIYDEGQQYREGAPHPYNTVVEPPAHSGDTPIPPQILGAGEQANQLPPYLAGPEEDQATTLALAEPPPVTGKRERETIPDEEEGKVKHRRQKRLQNPEPERYIPDPAAPPPNRPDILPLIQTEYHCHNEQKGRKHHTPIDFTTHEGIQGINLEDALNMNFPGLDRRDDPMFKDGSINNSISLRIKLVGYQPAKAVKARQITTKDHRKARNPITRQKLGREIAKLIDDYLKKGKNTFRVPFKDMYLVRLHNVSHASWQPELWYQNPQAASTSS